MSEIFGMTGIGSLQTEYNGISLSITVKTLNSKFLDLDIDIPPYLIDIEPEIRNLLKNKFRRGKIKLSVFIKSLKSDYVKTEINQELLKNIKEMISTIEQTTGKTIYLSLDNLLRIHGLININIDLINDKNFIAFLKKKLEETINKALEERKKEGKKIKKDLQSIYKKLKKRITDIEKVYKDYHSDIEKKLFEKLEYIRNQLQLESVNISKEDIIKEVMLLATKMDIFEEISRFNMHLENFLKTIKEGGEVGKKLDFILQELLREANTIASKSNNFYINKNVVEIKNYIEKARELVQNLE